MKNFVCLILFFCALLANAQQPSSTLPADIRFKAASSVDNAVAQSALEQALANNNVFPKDLLGGTMTCGPILWADLKGSANGILRQSKVVTSLLSIPDSLYTWSRGFTTDDQRAAFWQALLARYPNLKTAKVRKSNTDEIKFFWSAFPFDIEEPLFTLDTGSETFIVNLRVEKGKAVVWWIDRVGDLRSLRDEAPDAAEWSELLKAAEVDIPGSRYEAGRLYLFGKGIPADARKGREWLEKASEGGSLDAQMLLGMSYFSGTGLPKDLAAAAKYLKLAAQKGQPLAQYYVGVMYREGLGGLEKSDEKAILMLQAAADKNDASAEYDLGVMYAQGKGVPIDAKRACALYVKASEQGHVHATNNLGMCYFRGDDAELDHSKAQQLFIKAASQGNKNAMGNMVNLCAGHGDWAQAYMWVRIAEENGAVEGRTAIDQIKAHLTTNQIESAEARVKQWQSLYSPKSAGK